MKTLFLFYVDGAIVNSSEKITQKMTITLNKLKVNNSEMEFLEES
jgi:hypothetical protein